MDKDVVFETAEEYLKSIRELMSSRRLHGIVERRLTVLLSRLYPDSCVTPEVVAVLGGRNDLMQFFFDGRRVVIELLFSPSQVPQDLRLLEQCSADVKIAVLLDPEVNPKLAREYFHKKPDSFPYLWLRWVMMRPWQDFCLARLRELVDEEPAINHLRSILSTPAGLSLAEPLAMQLKEIERKMRPFLQTSDRVEDLSPREMIRRIILMEINKLGVPKHNMRSLYVWLDDAILDVVTLVLNGFQAFLVTNLEGVHAIYSAGDLVDDLTIGTEDDSSANAVLCLNHIINSVWRAQRIEPQTVTWRLKHGYWADDSTVEEQFDQTQEQ